MSSHDIQSPDDGKDLEPQLVVSGGKGSIMETDELPAKVNRRLRLKVDLIILPLMAVSSLMALLDKNALGFAALFGLTEDTKLQGQQYSWLGSIVYFGYMVAQFPLGWLFTKVRMGKFIGVILLCWGILLCSMLAAHNFAGLASLRFLLGLTEAGIMPANMILTGLWYRREEQPLRTAIWYNTIAGIIGGILAYAISHIHGHYATWQYIFLIYGSVTLGLGVAVFFLLPDYPAKAWFYNEEEKRQKVIRIAMNQTGQSTHNPYKKEQVFEALKDPKYWVLAVYALAWCIVNGGITQFNPLIISGFGYSRTKTTLLAAPQAAVALTSQVLLSIIPMYRPNVRCIIWALSCIPGLIGAVLVHTLDPTTSRNAALAGIYMMGFYNVSWVMVLSLISSNNGGTTKKSFATTSLNIWYCVGNIYAPQLFRSEEAPHYHTGIFAMMVSFAIQAACAVAYLLFCMFENKRRDREYGQVQHLAAAGLEASEKDLSDGQNRAFRYCY